MSIYYLGKPKITKHLEDKEVDEGNALTLNIEVYAVPETEVHWYVITRKNNLLLKLMNLVFFQV